MKKSIIRKGNFSIEAVRDLVFKYLFVKKADIEVDGCLVKANSDRYKTFFVKGTSCCKCGLEATHFVLEQCPMPKRYSMPDNRFHFNLYGMKDGKEVLFTKDHILPKSKGGKNILSNYVPMCKPCNTEKGNKVEE